MSATASVVTIPLRDEEVISLLRDDALDPLVRSLQGADPTIRVREDGPFVDRDGLRLGRKAWAPALQFLDLDGQLREFHRVAAAIREAATARGWMLR